MFGSPAKESSTMGFQFRLPALLLLGLLLLPGLGARAGEPAAPPLGILLVDPDGTWRREEQERLDAPSRPNLVSAWRDLFDPARTGQLTEAQKAALLADPPRLLASSRRAEVLRVQRVLLLGPEADGWVSALQVDLATGAREALRVPCARGERQAWLSLVDQVLQGGEPQLVPVVGNPESRMYHRPGAPHLSTRVPAEPWDDRGRAERAGYRPCPVCFPETNRLIQQDELERELGRAAAALVEQQYRVSQDPEERLRVTRLGERIMQANRFADAGYRFVVLESDELNAFSVPTGPIYVTTGLLRTLESPDELAGILAHELAHAERHHMLQQYERGQWVGLLGSVLRTATGYRWARKAGDFMGGLLARGFSRDFELEADREALLLAYGAGFRPEDFALTLTKLGEVSAQLGHGGGPDWFQTHPAVDGRLRQVREVLEKLGPLEKELLPLERGGDPELAAWLRRQARAFLEDPRPIRSFLEAWGALDLDAAPSPPPENEPAP